jgi:hypothetical protein
MPETYEVIACIVPKPCEPRVIEWLEEIEDYICTEAYSPVSESAAC